MKNHLALAAVAAALAALPGCSEPDGRVADMARQATHEQAEQNQRMVEGSKALAEGSKRLVEADAYARRDLVGLQQDLRKDQAEVGKQRDVLEAERKQIAAQRIQESQGGAFFLGFAVILVCLAPLVLAAFSLLGLWRPPTAEEQGQVFIEELTTLLRKPETTPALPGPDAATLDIPPENTSS